VSNNTLVIVRELAQVARNASSAALFQ